MFLAVLPAILGLFTVAGLAYWGRYERQVPTALVVIAVAASIASLVIAWRNTRLVAQRIERLAGGGGPRGASANSRPDAAGLSGDFLLDGRAGDRADERADELDALERVVTRVSDVEQATRARERAAAARVGEYAQLLAEASAAVSTQLTQIRLPLHILLENHFGALNENQEEMLAAAQVAAEAVEVELRRLREIAELDQGALALRRDLVHPGDLVSSLLPTLKSLGERTSVRVVADVAPGLPRLSGDWNRLQEALSLMLSDRVRYAPAGSEVGISVAAEPDRIRIRLDRGASHAPTADVLLARRLIAAHGGDIEEGPSRTEIVLPTRGGPPAGSRRAGLQGDNQPIQG
jgi:signal transduction histidine kinase